MNDFNDDRTSYRDQESHFRAYAHKIEAERDAYAKALKEEKADSLSIAREASRLLEENERLKALLARTAAFVDPDILKHNSIGADLTAALAGREGESK